MQTYEANCAVMTYWYVIFVRTGKERKVEKLLKERLDADVFMPFVPLQEVLFKKAEIIKKEMRILFPSYVFIETDIPSHEFLERICPFVYTISDIVRILKYSDTEIPMREAERLMLLSLCSDHCCIESSYGIIEGDRIHIVEGPLKGKESIVRKVNRHKRQALIEIEFMGDVRLASVALEIIEKRT